MVAVQYNSIGLINTQYLCDYTRAHSGHVMLLPARASPSVVFQQSKCKDLFHMCNECSLSNITWHLVLTCQNLFRDIFPDSPVPNKSTVSRLVNRFRDTGSVQDRNRSGRPSVLSDDSSDDIRQTLLRSPRKSLRKLSVQSGLSYGSVHKATKILSRPRWSSG
jgi:hypothetical protein